MNRRYSIHRPWLLQHSARRVAAAHLANIVVRTGQPVKFDANLETIFGSESAQKLLGREYRNHWATPKIT